MGSGGVVCEGSGGVVCEGCEGCMELECKHMKVTTTIGSLKILQHRGVFISRIL